jgi:exosortase/archaeosortase family protein
MRPTGSHGARPLVCALGVGAVWHTVDHDWRALEALLVSRIAAFGPGSVEWAGGNQIWVNGDVAPFVAVVGPWCSSISPVLAAVAVCAAFGRTRAAAVAAGLAALVLFVGNLVRMVAVVAIGARSGAADLELAHDGWATWWAVAVVLGAAAIVAAALRRDLRSPTPAGEVELATSR